MVTRLIVTGADGTGKTEYCKRRALREDIYYKHFVVPREDTNATHEYWQPMVNDKHRGFIYDRGFVDEMVWPSIFNRPEVDGFDAGWLLEEYAHAGASLMIVYRNAVDIVTELKLRGEDSTEIGHAIKAQDAFVNLALNGNLWPLPWSIVHSDLLKEMT